MFIRNFDLAGVLQYIPIILPPTVVTLYGQGMLVILDILQNILASWFLHSVRLTFTTHLFNTVFDVVLKLA